MPYDAGPSEPERFEALARAVIDPVRRYLARRTDAATADDVLSETLLVMWRRRHEQPADCPPAAWAMGIARLSLANAQRAARRQERVAGKVARLDPPLELAPVTAADPAIGEALARLGADEAELLRLWAWEELAPREIAEVLGISPNAVSLRLHRAKQKLADELRKNADPAGHEQVKGDTDG